MNAYIKSYFPNLIFNPYTSKFSGRVKICSYLYFFSCTTYSDTVF